MTLLRATGRRMDAVLLGFVLLVGLSHPIGSVLGIPFLQSMGLALASSPTPAVFHYPEIAIRMRLELRGAAGELRELDLGPAEFARLHGPMTRRVPYTMPAVARLPRRIWTSIYQHGLCADGPLARELGIDFDVRRARLQIDFRRELYPEGRILEVRCPR